MSKKFDTLKAAVVTMFGTDDIAKVQESFTSETDLGKKMEKLDLFVKYQKALLKPAIAKKNKVSMSGIFRNIYTVLKKVAKDTGKTNFDDLLLEIEKMCSEEMKNHMSKSLVKFLENGSDSDEEIDGDSEEETDLDDELELEA